ncbi:protein disulfide isomerase [Saccharomycopsis crataegensis]|uniref:protein disulfide-isomerase n=1 Tax=Saccharomycopsis crataegensis TaxID=43959 RepID=A0AAV5QK09_9ASCO|nr:protein disulfide isomerase [Saccharomycopsis crataegensis]
MRFAGAFFLFSILATVFASNVIEATDKDFIDIVQTPGTYSFVKFYATWCGHCKTLAPIWEELADVYAPSKNIQIVSIDADKYSRIGNRFGIKGFPTLKMFVAGEAPKDYQGKRELDSFIKFIEYATGTKTPTIAAAKDHIDYFDDDTYKQKIEGKHGFFAITASWCGYCKQLKPNWKQLASAFKNDDSVVIGDVIASDVAAEEIKDKFDVKSFPTIVYVAPGDVNIENAEYYQGGRSADELVAWVNSKTHIGRKSDGKLDESAGKLEIFNDKIQDLLASKGLDEAKDQLSELKDTSIAYSAKYYGKLLDKISSGESGYFAKEYARLQGILKKGNSLNDKVHDNLIKRINILSQFLGADDKVSRDEL